MTAVHPFAVPTGELPAEVTGSGRYPKSARLRIIEVVSEREISTIIDSLPDLPCTDAADRKCQDELRFPDEEIADVGALKNSMTIFLRVMMFLGVYFSQGESSEKTKGREQGRSTAEDISHVSEMSSNGSRREVLIRKAQKFYTIAVTTYLWVNAIRFMTVFTSNDSFNATLINKLGNLAWMFQVAVSQTSMVVACQSGRLESILSDIRISTEFARLVRLRTISSVFGAFLFIGILGSYFIYAFFAARTSVVSFNIYFTPFYTHIPVGDAGYIALRAVFVSVGIFMLSGWVLPLALNHLLTLIFWGQFRLLYDRFSAAIDPETGLFNGSIRLFRRRHQKLCKSVRHADYFMKISFVAGFGCHMANVILSMYLLVTFPMTDVTFGASSIFSLLVNSIGLVIAALDGILVNSSAHKILERIHSIDISKLSFNENVELTMFHKRLSGNPIGFSVLGMFVISKKTLLTVLSLMITYFLLVVKLSKTFSRSSTADSVTCSLYTNKSTSA